MPWAPTLLVELLRALAPLRQPHNGHHLGSQAGAPLLISSQRGRVGSPTAAAAAAATTTTTTSTATAGTLLQAVHGAGDAGGANHVPGRRTQATRAGDLHRAAEHHDSSLDRREGPEGAEQRLQVGWEGRRAEGGREQKGQRIRTSQEEQEEAGVRSMTLGWSLATMSDDANSRR